MYGFKILCEISKGTFEISRKILNPYTAKYAFYEVLKIWQVMISFSYDILSLSETSPRMAMNGGLNPATGCLSHSSRHHEVELPGEPYPPFTSMD